MKFNCACQNGDLYGIVDDSVCQSKETRSRCRNEFNNLREQCFLLQQYLPDSHWNKIKDKPFGVGDEEYDSFWIHAYNSGNLKRIMKLMHRLLTKDSDPNSYRDDLNKQYINKSESWINIPENEERIKRHRAFRSDMGKIYELLFAGFIEDNGYKICDLEAWNSNSPDIVATSPASDIRIQFEVKYIGMSDDLFNGLFCNNNNTNPAPYKLTDYVLFRMCEASIQLWKKQKENEKRVVVILILDNPPNRIQMNTAVNNRFIDFENPTFFKPDELERDMLNNDSNGSSKQKVRNIISNPDCYLSKLDDYWIFFSNWTDFEPCWGFKGNATTEC